MRDPKRIMRILAKVMEVWKKYPDMRFIQLQSFILGQIESPPQDFFFLEDDRYEEVLDKILA